MTKNELEECIHHTNMVVQRWKQNPRTKVSGAEVSAVFRGLINKYIGYNRRNVFKQVSKNLIIYMNPVTNYIDEIRIINTDNYNLTIDAHLKNLDKLLREICMNDLIPTIDNTLTESVDLFKCVDFEKLEKIKF